MIHVVNVINLQRSSVRLGFIKENASKLGLRVRRVDAVDGALIGKLDLDRWISPRSSFGHSKWLVGQVGCFMSHYRAWETISEEAEPYGLIIEDDVHLSGDLSKLMNDLRWIPADADIVHLESTPAGIALGRTYQLKHVCRRIAEVKSPIWAAGAYLLRRDVARWLLACPNQYDLPVDRFLFDKSTSRMSRSLKVYIIDPGLAIQDKYLFDAKGKREMESLIDGEDMKPVQTGFGKRGMHTMARWLRRRTTVRFRA